MRACSEKITVVDEETGEKTEEKGRLISVQFYLKNDKTDELTAMDTVGPTLGEDAVICVRRKLEFGHYFVDQVIIYETEIGVEAMKFHVEDQYETFGVPSEGATETVLSFTNEQRMISLSGYSSFSGIKGVSLSSLDLDCVKLVEEQSSDK